MSNKIIILTSGIKTGKTTLLQQFCKGNNDVAGILTPIINAKRVFYDIASDVFFYMEAQPNEEPLIVGKYLFSKTAFVKAGMILLNADKNNGPKYLIIDEIGPLEIRLQEGFFNCLNKILGSPFNYTLILVVRKILVDEMIATFNLHNATVLNPEQMQDYLNLRV
jgi:nucleoside-triphosphatase THEP1